MFGIWQSDVEYASRVEVELSGLSSNTRRPLKHSLKGIKETLLELHLDPVGAHIEQYYSERGRPAKGQATIFRSLVLWQLLGSRGIAVVGLTNWVDVLAGNPLYTALLGVSSSELPPLGSYYDLMDRLWANPAQFNLYARNKTFAKDYIVRSPSQKPTTEDGKAPEKNAHLVDTMCDILKKGRPAYTQFETILQSIFDLAAIRPSIKAGIIPTDSVIASGDGTAIYSKASPFGHRTAEEHEHIHDEGYEDSGLRHFSDPDARLGYDSDKKKSYLGYSGYIYSFYSSKYKADLPLCFRLFGAQRHDSVASVIVLQDMRKHSPELNITDMPLDSAHDAMAIYELLDLWGIQSYIDLNKRKSKNQTQEDITITPQGTPICAAGLEMYHCGFNKQNCSTKWRCPLAVAGEMNTCPCKEMCHQKKDSAYGRTIYLPCSENLRIYPKVPRSSEKYKNVYKNRTASERVNKRILVDYKLSDSKIRGAKHYSFVLTIIGICMHMEARAKAKVRNSTT